MTCSKTVGFDWVEFFQVYGFIKVCYFSRVFNDLLEDSGFGLRVNFFRSLTSFGHV